MVNAFFLFLSSLFIMSIIDRINRGMFFLFFLLIHSLVLFIIWVACSFGITFLFIPLFSYSYVTKIFLFLMFWTLANDIVDSRSARREFPFIAAGGTLGAICVSFTIPWLLKIMSVRNLLLVWAILCFSLAVFFLQILRSFKINFMQVSDSEKRTSTNIKSLANDLILVNREPLLASISILYFLLFFILLNQHYSFYDAIKTRFVQAEKLAGFLGYFNGISMAATFLVQITLSGVIIKKIGSSRSMLMLPAVLSLVFGALAIISFTFNAQDNSVIVSSMLFWCIVVGVGLRIAFFDSFFSPNFQLFFSSLPQDIRGRGKLAIEGIIKPSAMVFAGLWLIFITGTISFGINSILLFFMTSLMILVTFRIRSKYTESLTQYLSDFKSRIPLSFLDTSEFSGNLNTLFLLSGKLRKESFEIKCYIIEILIKINTEDSIKILTDYLSQTDEKIRATIISSLTKLKNDNLKPLFISMLQDSDKRVIANSIFALAAYHDHEINEGLQVFLYSKNNRIRANAVIALWPLSNQVMRKNLLMVLKEMLDSFNNATCSSALYAIYEIASIKDTGSLLESFYNSRKDAIISVRALWHHFSHSICKDASQKAINTLLDMSNSVNRKKRNDIALCIAQSCKNGYNINNLIGDLKTSNAGRREIILRVLCNLKPDVNKEIEEILEKIAKEEVQFTYENLVSYYILTGKKEDMNIGVQLLSSAILEEIINNHISNLVQIAAILDDSGQVKKIMRRLNHENKHVRARALEVLDNAGNMKVNRWLIKLIDTCDTRGKTMKVPDRYLGDRDTDTVFSIATSYTQSSNVWIRKCAGFAFAIMDAGL